MFNYVNKMEKGTAFLRNGKILVKEDYDRKEHCWICKDLEKGIGHYLIKGDQYCEIVPNVMKITRCVNGEEKTFGLSKKEMIETFNFIELENAIKSVESAMTNILCAIDFSKEQLLDIAKLAIHNLSKNDSYMFAYWDTFEETIREYIKENNLKNN